jgi:S1-C subfamily serine protease
MGGTGTCFGVAPGVLVTARHVTGDRDSVFVRFGDATRLVARVDSQRFENDIALLRIVDEEHETLALADRDSHYPGASVFALGYPATDLLGRELKVTDGVISSLSGPDDRDGMMQTSTPIQPGSSGGPLIDPGGRAVGMVVATAVSEVFYYEVGELPQNVNWAVRSDVIAEVLETAGVPVPDDGRPPADRRTALERALAATCFVETN